MNRRPALAVARRPSPAAFEGLVLLAVTGFAMLALADTRDTLPPWLFWATEGFFSCLATQLALLACLLAGTRRNAATKVPATAEAGEGR